MNLQNQIISYPQSSTLSFINCVLLMYTAFFFPLTFPLKDSAISYLAMGQDLSTYLSTHLLQQTLKIISK